MRIFADIPFFFGNAPLVFVTDESAFADMVDHCSSVLHALYHSQNTAMCPLWLLGRRLSGHGFMLGGCWNALRIQFLCNLCARLAINHFHENTADYRSGFHVDDKVMLVSRIGFIPVWDCVHKLCLLLFHSHCRLDLLGQVFAVIVIDKVLEGNIHTDSLAFMFRAGIMVIDRLEADTEKRENMLQIVTNFKIVSTETGKVFHYDAANFSMLCALYHLCKVRTIKVRAGETVIAELYTRQIAEKRVLIQMTIDEHTLRCDTVALVLDFVCALVNVFKRQAQINSDLLFHQATSFLIFSQVFVSAANSST